MLKKLEDIGSSLLERFAPRMDAHAQECDWDFKWFPYCGAPCYGPCQSVCAPGCGCDQSQTVCDG